MARIGSGVRPELGRTNYGGFLAGAQQGSAAIGRGIEKVGAGVGDMMKRQKAMATDAKVSENLFGAVSEAYQGTPLGDMAAQMHMSMADQDTPLRDRYAQGQSGKSIIQMMLNKSATDAKAALQERQMQVAEGTLGMQQEAAKTEEARRSAEMMGRAQGADIMAGRGNLVDFVKGFEGWNPSVYDDYNQSSIGYGTKARPGETKISQEEGEERLRQELRQHAHRVDSMGAKHGYNWTEAERNALISFDYNTGDLEQLTDNGTRSKAEIAAKIPEYRKAGGKVLPGLVRRREAEKKMFLSGSDPAVRAARGEFLRQAGHYTRQTAPKVGSKAITYTDPNTGEVVTQEFRTVDGEVQMGQPIAPSAPKGSMIEDPKTAVRKQYDKNMIDRQTAAIEDGALSGDRILKSKRVLKLLDKGTYTGAGASQWGWWRSVAEVLNVKTNVADYQELRNLLSEGIKTNMASTSGAISEKEMEMFEAWAANISNTPEGNRRIVMLSIAIEERKRMIAQMYKKGQRAGTSPGVLEQKVEDAVNKWGRETPLFGAAQGSEPGTEPDANSLGKWPKGNPQGVTDDQIYKAFEDEGW